MTMFLLRTYGITVTAAALMLLACTQREPASTTPPATDGPATASSSAAATDTWLGQWNGPEGTFLRIARADGHYQITIQNLDGPQTFEGTGKGDKIRFERKGVPEAIHATDGVGTGMKWLAEKKDCLVVRDGEGFCRD